PERQATVQAGAGQLAHQRRQAALVAGAGQGAVLQVVHQVEVRVLDPVGQCRDLQGGPGRDVVYDLAVTLRCFLLLCGLPCLLSSADGRGAPRPPGCPRAAPPESEAVRRFEVARTGERFVVAAAAAWDAWCASGRKAHLIEVCAMHVRAGSCQAARDIIAYARRRKGLDGQLEQGLVQCARDIESRCPAAAAAPPPAPAAPPPAPAAPPAAPAAAR